MTAGSPLPGSDAPPSWPRARAAPTPTRGCRPPPASATYGPARRPAAPSADCIACSTLGPPGWATQCATSSEPQPVVGEERLHVPAEVLGDDVRDAGRQHDPEPGAAHVPAHHALGVRVHPRPRGQHRRAGDTERGGPARAQQDDRRGAVAEQAGRHQVRGRVVVALHGQRAQLDRQQHGDLVRVADQVVVHPSDARRPRDAAETEDRDPLHVLAQPQPGHEARLQARRGDTGDGRRHDQVHVLAVQPGGRRARLRTARSPRSTASDTNASFAAGEAVQPGVRLQRQHQVPGPHPGRRVQPLQQATPLRVGHDQRAEGRGDDLLRVRVLAQRRPDRRQNRGGSGLGSGGHSPSITRSAQRARPPAAPGIHLPAPVSQRASQPVIGTSVRTPSGDSTGQDRHADMFAETVIRA